MPNIVFNSVDLPEPLCPNIAIFHPVQPKINPFIPTLVPSGNTCLIPETLTISFIIRSPP